MTRNQIVQYKKYLQSKAAHDKEALKSERSIARREYLNDDYVFMSDMAEICDIALAQIYDKEYERKGGSTEELWVSTEAASE